MALYILERCKGAATGAVVYLIPLLRYCFAIPMTGIFIALLIQKFKSVKYLLFLPDILYGFALIWIFLAMYIWLAQFSWTFDIVTTK
jgi:hypothetical protein